MSREERSMGRKKWQIDTALKFWRLTHWAKRIGHVAPFRQAAGLIASEEAFRGSFVPIGEDIEVQPGTAAPGELVADFIRRACHRTIIDFCPCRVGEGCERHPRDLGCMLLGAGSRDVHPEVGRPATVEEGLAHLERALESGLLPFVGHIKADKVVFGVQDFGKLLTLCFCCRCCCILRSEMGGLVDAYPRSLVRLEGVVIEIGEGCTGCGACVPVCPVGNISLEAKAAVMGTRCIGCGTCARACTEGCIPVRLETGARLLEDLRRRVEEGVDIG